MVTLARALQHAVRVRRQIRNADGLIQIVYRPNGLLVHWTLSAWEGRDQARAFRDWRVADGPRHRWGVHYVMGSRQAPILGSGARTAACACEIRTAEDIVTGPDSRSTTAPFSKEEIALIKQAILTPGAMVECPRCGTLLKTDAHLATEEHNAKVLWVFCETCKRNLIVRDLPTDREGS